MEIDVIRKLIKRYRPGHSDFVIRCLKAEDYYKNRTDILIPGPHEEKEK